MSLFTMIAGLYSMFGTVAHIQGSSGMRRRRHWYYIPDQNFDCCWEIYFPDCVVVVVLVLEHGVVDVFSNQDCCCSIDAADSSTAATGQNDGSHKNVVDVAAGGGGGNCSPPHLRCCSRAFHNEVVVAAAAAATYLFAAEHSCVDPQDMEYVADKGDAVRCCTWGDDIRLYVGIFPSAASVLSQVVHIVVVVVVVPRSSCCDSCDETLLSFFPWFARDLRLFCFSNEETLLL